MKHAESGWRSARTGRPASVCNALKSDIRPERPTAANVMQLKTKSRFADSGGSGDG